MIQSLCDGILSIFDGIRMEKKKLRPRYGNARNRIFQSKVQIFFKFTSLCEWFSCNIFLLKFFAELYKSKAWLCACGALHASIISTYYCFFNRNLMSSSMNIMEIPWLKIKHAVFFHTDISVNSNIFDEIRNLYWELNGCQTVQNEYIFLEISIVCNEIALFDRIQRIHLTEAISIVLSHQAT